MHAKSNKFLKLVPKHRALATGCYQVELDPKGAPVRPRDPAQGRLSTHARLASAARRPLLGSQAVA
jgi:hypothetical protein